MKTKKLIKILLIIQIFLTLLALNTGLDITLVYALFLTLLVTGWSIFSGIFALKLNKKNIFNFVSKFTFFSISSLVLLVLLYLNVLVLRNGKLGESGLLFFVVPIYGFYIFIGSIILGTIIFFIRKKLKR